MSKAKLDGEFRVRDYIAAKGLRVEGFTKAQMRRGKTPDFKVFDGEDLAFYCEVKTSQEDEWLAGGLKRDPIYNRLCNYINDAVDQLGAVNPALEHPNVLAIVNGDLNASFADLVHVLTGNAYSESGDVIPIFSEYSDGRISKTKLRVHLYLWFNESQPDQEPWKFFPEVHEEHHSALCRRLNVSPSELGRVPPPTR